MKKLVVTGPRGPLTDAETLLGRSTHVEYKELPSPMSRKHGSIKQVGDSVTFTDAGSKYGTWQVLEEEELVTLDGSTAAPRQIDCLLILKKGEEGKVVTLVERLRPTTIDPACDLFILGVPLEEGEVKEDGEPEFPSHVILRFQKGEEGDDQVEYVLELAGCMVRPYLPPVSDEMPVPPLPEEPVT